MSASILLIRPKYAHNVGQVVRAASCFDADRVWFTGDRVSLEVGKGERLPREERMREYEKVELRHVEGHYFDALPRLTPVAIELVPGTESLPDFEHPDDALYVFGPEDGTLDRGTLGMCHRFVSIPTAHCVNLSAAAYLVLYDRLTKKGAPC